MNDLRVTFFGDSICVGQFIALHRGWVTRTSSELYDLGEQRGCRIVVTNASASGRTTRQALEAMPYELQSHAPHIVLVQFGLNDCNRWESDGGLSRVSEKAFAANLEEILERALRFGARTVFLHTNHPTTRDQRELAGSGMTFEASNRRYNEVIREVAGRSPSSMILCDLENAFRAVMNGVSDRLRPLLLEDGLHLSEAGHQLYFETVYPRLRQRVEELVDDVAA